MVFLFIYLYNGIFIYVIYFFPRVASSASHVLLDTKGTQEWSVILFNIAQITTLRLTHAVNLPRVHRFTVERKRDVT